MAIGLDQNFYDTSLAKAKYAKTTTTGSYSSSGSGKAKSSTEGDTFVSSVIGDVGSGNTCTDGSDDGKITFGSMLANIGQGVVRGATNMVKSMVEHPFKTAATIAVAFVPVVGPAAVGTMCAIGAFNGAKEIYSAVQTANSATTDEEAKAAFEHIGSGALTTGLSVLGAKAAVKTVRGQISGGSNTYNLFKEEGLTKNVLKEGANEFGSNAYNFAKTTVENVKTKAGNIKSELTNLKDAAKNNTLGDYLGEKATSVKQTVQNKIDTAKQKYNESKYGKEGAAEVKNAEGQYDSAKKAYDDAVAEAKKNNPDITQEELQSQTQGLKDAMDQAKTSCEQTQKDYSSKARTDAKIENAKKFTDDLPESEVTAKHSNGVVKEQTYTDTDGNTVKIEFNEQGAPLKRTTTGTDGSVTVDTLDGTGVAGESSGATTKTQTTEASGKTTETTTGKNGSTKTVTKEGDTKTTDTTGKDGSAKTVTNKKTKTYETENTGTDGSRYTGTKVNGATRKTYTYNGKTYYCDTVKGKSTWYDSTGAEVTSNLSLKLKTKAIELSSKYSVQNGSDYLSKNYYNQDTGTVSKACA